MHTKALTNLTDKELSLLRHLAAFRAPFYFDDVRVSFISNERNRSALLALFFTLHAKRYIRLATIPEALPVVNKKIRILLTKFRIWAG